MRTVILVAGFSVADSININWINKEPLGFYFVVTILAIAMDIIEFLKNNLKDN